MARPALQETEVEEFKASLYEHALDLILREGYESLSMRRLSQQMGCSHAKAYRYFPNKEALVSYVRARAFERYGDFLLAWLGDVKGPLARLRRLALGYVSYASTHKAEFQLMFTFYQPRSLENETLKNSVNRAWGVFLQTVEEAIEAGQLSGEANAITHLLWAGMHGVAALHMAGKLVLGMGQQALAESMIDTLLAGIKSPAACPKGESDHG